MKFFILKIALIKSFFLNLYSYIYYKIFIKNFKINKKFFDYITLKNKNVKYQNYVKTQSNFFNKIKFNFYYNILRYCLKDEKKVAYEFIENYFDVTQSNYKKKNILQINKHYKILSKKINQIKKKKFIFHFGSSVSFFNIHLKKKFPKKNILMLIYLRKLQE